MFGSAWRLLTAQLFIPRVFPMVEQSAIGQYLLLHDSSAVPDCFGQAHSSSGAPHRIRLAQKEK